MLTLPPKRRGREQAACWQLLRFAAGLTRPDGTSARVFRQPSPVETTHPHRTEPPFGTTHSTIGSPWNQPSPHIPAVSGGPLLRLDASSMDRPAFQLTAGADDWNARRPNQPECRRMERPAFRLEHIAPFGTPGDPRLEHIAPFGTPGDPQQTKCNARSVRSAVSPRGG